MESSAVAQAPSAPKSSLASKMVPFFCMVFGMFMAILDIQIVSASLAEIQAGLSASSDEISWVQTAYLIAEVIMIPLSGSLNRILSTRVLFTLASAGFTLSSALCATATTINQMILYRAIQGFIGGSMIPSVFSVTFTAFTVKQRNILSPIIGLVATLAPTIGPTVGGYLSHALSWHWLFLINVPTGILVTIIAWMTIDFDKGDLSLAKSFDWTGFIGLALFLGCLEYILEEGPRHDWFQDNAICFFTFVMGIGSVVFFFRAFTAKEPIVDLSAFRDLNFALGSCFSFVMGIGLFGLTYLYPAYLSQIRQYDAMQIGETMFVSGLTMLLSAPIVALVSSRLDPRFIMMLGFGGFAYGTWLVTNITSDWDFWELFLPQIFRGFCMMLAMVTINNVALGTLSPEKMKNASGLYNLTRNLGGAVGLALLSTLIIRRNAFHYARLAELIHSGNYAAQQMLSMLEHKFNSAGLNGKALSLAQLSNLVRQQAAVMTFADAFFILTLFFVALAISVWLVKKPKNSSEGVGH